MAHDFHSTREDEGYSSSKTQKRADVSIQQVLCGFDNVLFTPPCVVRSLLISISNRSYWVLDVYSCIYVPWPLEIVTNHQANHRQRLIVLYKRRTVVRVVEYNQGYLPPCSHTPVKPAQSGILQCNHTPVFLSSSTHTRRLTALVRRFVLQQSLEYLFAKMFRNNTEDDIPVLTAED